MVTQEKTGLNEDLPTPVTTISSVMRRYAYVSYRHERRYQVVAASDRELKRRASPGSLPRRSAYWVFIEPVDSQPRRAPGCDRIMGSLWLSGASRALSATHPDHFQTFHRAGRDFGNKSTRLFRSGLSTGEAPRFAVAQAQQRRADLDEDGGVVDSGGDCVLLLVGDLAHGPS